MMPVPSWRLVRLSIAGTVAAFALLIFPSAWLPLVTFDILLAALAVVDWLITPRPGRLEARRLTPERISVLVPHPVLVAVRNHSAVRLHVRLRDTIPEVFETATTELAGVVPAVGETSWEYTITPKTRGAFSWGAIHLRYRSLLGLWERQRTVEAAAQSRVYPNLVMLEHYQLLARSNRLEALGIRKVRQRGSAWEFESLRDYVEGDDVRLIDWKATARRRKAIVRNQEAERNQTILLLVDSGRLMNAEVDGVPKLDHAVNTTLILAHVALARGDRVGLCTFSSTVHSWSEPRARRGQIRLLTDALYDLRGDFTETDHGRALRLVASRHSKRALLVVLTDFVDTQTASEMMAHLQLAARRYLVLFVALKDPFLERVARIYPASPIEGFRKTAAIDLLRERKQVLEGLRQVGIHVIDADPGSITPPVINRYLEMTHRGLL